MLRLTGAIFSDLAIWMVGLGLLTGLGFPFFVLWLGVSPDQALTPQFFAATVCAGLLVGGCNFVLARTVVGQRLHLLSERMRVVSGTIRHATYTGDWSACRPESCRIEADSRDELGDAAGSFNELVRTLAHYHQVEAAVQEFGSVLSSHLELEALAEASLTYLLKASGADAGALLVAVDGGLRLGAQTGLIGAERLARSERLVQVLARRQPSRLDLADEVAVDGLLVEFRPRAVLAIPIEFGQVPLGIAVLATGSELAPEASSLLDLFRGSLGVALQNALSHERLQRLAAIDALTACYNRRFGLIRFEEELARSVRTRSPLGVLMLDVDHFKAVNDTYGHLAGDRVLARVAEVTRSVLREGDVLCRYGGEEFLAVLPGAARRDVERISERIRRAVRDAAITDGPRTIRVTVSLGGSVRDGAAPLDGEQLLHHADQALYAAKATGRDRVVIARPSAPLSELARDASVAASAS